MFSDDDKKNALLGGAVLKNVKSTAMSSLTSKNVFPEKAQALAAKAQTLSDNAQSLAAKAQMVPATAQTLLAKTQTPQALSIPGFVAGSGSATSMLTELFLQSEI